MGGGNSGGGGSLGGKTGGGALKANDQGQQPPVQQGVPVTELAPEKKQIVQEYIGGMGAHNKKYKMTTAQLNRSLRDEEWLKKQPLDFQQRAKAYANELDSALKDVKDHPATTYRVANDIYLPQSSKTLSEMYTPGETITTKGFTSTSLTKDAPYFPYNEPAIGSVRFKVEGKHGKHVENVASYMYKDQREVLYNRGTKFKVKSKNYNQDLNTWDIHLKEV